MYCLPDGAKGTIGKFFDRIVQFSDIFNEAVLSELLEIECGSMRASLRVVLLFTIGRVRARKGEKITLSLYSALNFLLHQLVVGSCNSETVCLPQRSLFREQT